MSSSGKLQSNIQRAQSIDRFINISIIFLLVIISLFILFPLYIVTIVSFAKYENLARQFVYLIPNSFDITAYRVLFKGGQLMNSFMVSLFVTLVGTLLSITLSVITAYSLSKKTLPGRKIIIGALIFTMYFNGGIVPYYLTVKDIGLVNNIFVMIIPPAINTFYLFIMKNYFNNFPSSIEEAAKIDGASDIGILTRIVLPISAPIIATFSLFYMVDRWNEWWHAMVFISNTDISPLQIFLRQVLIDFDITIGSPIGQSLAQNKTPIYPESIRMAIVVITAVPIAIIYPFLQKYFVKGILVGSLKD